MNSYFFKSGCVLILLFCGGLLFNCAESNKQKQAIKPNVLLLFMDDLRPELASYGKSLIKSPNIDLLASNGIQFNNAYCNVPVCGASRASMLTGMYPTKNRFLNYNTFVSKETPEAITLPQLFKQNGYTTISNGKVYHHLDDNINDWNEVWRPYAFDENDKGLAPTDYWQSLWRDYQLPKNIKTYIETGTGPAYEKVAVNDSVYIDGILTKKVVRDLKRLNKSNKPFFLTAGFISPHLPFNAPEKYWNLYPEESIKQPYNNFIPKNAPKQSIGNSPELRQYAFIPKEGQVTDDTAKKLIHGYYATISYVDALIGEIMQNLKALELDKNTIVILVSDHGYNLQEHTLWAKFNNYNTAMQTPLIISIPGNEGGFETNALVELVDIYPTLANLCGLPLPKNQLDGESLEAILKAPKLKGKDYVFIKKDNGFTLKTPQYSYTEYINPETNIMETNMLYDHENDKDENINVANSSKYKAVVNQLSQTLHNEFRYNIYGE